MADRIIKGDSGNDVIIQNNTGSRKIEVTNSGDVEVIGDVKTTTVKATNLKANDGTAGLEVADSTGEVTSSGGLKATNVKTTNLKANDGTSGISIADSTGRVTFSENNPVIQLGSNAIFPDGHFIKDPISATYTGSTISVVANNSDIVSATISADSTADKILILAHITYRLDGNSSVTNTFNYLRILDQTNSDTELCRAIVQYEASANNFAQGGVATFCHIVSPSTTGNNTYMLNAVHGAGRIVIRGNSDSDFVNPTQIQLFYIKS
tara:strand:+ start:7262 stop:8059 length:798 start_codon:yes stop_codon:yes gene_type:complete